MTRLLAVLAALLFTSSAIGEPIRWGGSARVRVENWRWFETPGHEDSYLFFGTLIRVAASQQRERLDWTAELAQPSLLNLPNGAVAPAPHGQLGFGGAYYAANGNDTNSASLFLKQAAIRFQWPSHSLRVGRFEFMDGTEVAPKDATLAAVKAQRVAHRLIGNFGLSHVGRSLDGLQYVHARPEFNVTALMVRPSAGVFDTSGMDQVDDVTLRYVAVTHSQAVMDARLFAIGYSDSREVLKTDNRPLAARAADRRAIDILTLGGHYLQAFGPANVLVWGAWQTGEWGSLDHQAAALDLEVGYTIGGRMNASVRGGVFRSSGDQNSADGEHGTFFQILPTPRVYVRIPFYSGMNSTDLFVHVSLKPTARLTVTSEIHRLSLTERSDLWYSGGGAFQDETFGFAGRPAGGGDELGIVGDVNADFALTSKTTLTVYLASARGGNVIRSIYGDRTASFAYFEVLRRF